VCKSIPLSKTRVTESIREAASINIIIINSI